MKQQIRKHGWATLVIAVVLLALALFVARYATALNPFDGCTFPEGRTGPRDNCHAASWVWNE